MARRKLKHSTLKYVKRFWYSYFAVVAFIVLFFYAISSGWLGFMPSFEDLENPKSNLASEIISSDQALLGKYYLENRSSVKYEDISPFLVDALIATEDIRYERHSGVDSKAMLRVVFGLMTGKRRGGGSTVTQQLAKNLFPRKGNRNIIQTIFIKFKEWVTAIRLEKNYSKNEIIAMYFNTVPFGSQAYGIKSAARTFYGKSPDSLNLEESSLLVGILKAPSGYSPVRHPDRALKRREIVLSQMLKYEYITADVYDSVRQLPIDMSQYRMQDHRSGLATYFREYLRMYLKNWCKNNFKPDGTPYNLYTDGLKIYTTINSKMQQYAEEAVTEHIGGELQDIFFRHWDGRRNAPFDYRLTRQEIDDILNQAVKRSNRYRSLKSAAMPQDSIELIFNTPVEMRIFTWKGSVDTVMTPMDSILYYKHFLLGGLMSVEPQTGFVKAYVGGINYEYFQYDHVTQGKRQVGSTFKPFLYTLAMQEGEFQPCSKVPNVQVRIDLPEGGAWEPSNSSDAREGEMVTLKWALANSVNWVSAFLIKRYRAEPVIQIARKMGVTSDIPAVPSIALGSPDISLCEMVGAFSTFVNKGIHIKPVFITRIEDKNGHVIQSFVPEQNEAMSEETAYLMLGLMKGVVQHGTGIRLRLKYGFANPIAGKTGTTQNNSDGWFLGLTPDLVTGVWVGCEDRSVHFRALSLGQGANTALPIWALYMKKIYNDESLDISKDDFEKPASGLTVETDCSKFKEESGTEEGFIDEPEF